MIKILITDSNEFKYGYTYSFRIQRKTNGNWQELNKIYDDQYFYNTLYDFNEKNQLTIDLDFKKYYGTLEIGTYRIVKPAYNVGYFLIDFYSDEFEIK